MMTAEPLDPNAVVTVDEHQPAIPPPPRRRREPNAPTLDTPSNIDRLKRR